MWVHLRVPIKIAVAGWRKSVPQGHLKVAQYEVLGNEARRHVRPARDDRKVWRLVPRAHKHLPGLVNRPVRDGTLFKNANPALRTGLLSNVPVGLIFSSLPPTCEILIATPLVDADGLKRGLSSQHSFGHLHFCHALQRSPEPRSRRYGRRSGPGASFSGKRKQVVVPCA